MRRFCFRHLSPIIAVCMIATSSYVLFDLLDLDGSGFEQTGQTCGFEAVMPDCGGEIKLSMANTPVLLPGSLRGLLFTTSDYNSLASPSAFSPTLSYRTVFTRNATRKESASTTQEGDPAQRLA